MNLKPRPTSGPVEAKAKLPAAAAASPKPSAAIAAPGLWSLLRLGGWAFGAALAIGIVATVAHTDRGSERIQQVLGSLVDPQAVPQTQLVRTYDAEAEVRRLALQIQMLNMDRDRLSSRVASLERNLDDVTGSVKAVQTSRITAPPKSNELRPLETKPAEIAVAPQISSPPVISAPATVAAAANPPIPANDNKPGAPPQPPIRAAELPKIGDKLEPGADATVTGTARAIPLPTARNAPQEIVKPEIAKPEPPQQQAAVRPDTGETPQAAPSADPLGGKLEFAIDLGGASSVDQLRALWQSTKAAHAPLLDGLQPSAVLRPTGKNGAPQLRLMAGPFADAAGAAALCKSFSASRSTNCRPFAFDGQKLPLR